MPRFLKQFLYGLFYLLVIAGIVFLIYPKPMPSCFDHIQNQGEQGVDCGGPCKAFCTANLVPLQSIGVPAIFSGVGGRQTFFGQIENPNSNFGAQNFSYAFETRDVQGNLLGVIPGESFIYPDQTKYVAAINEKVSSGTVSVDLAVSTDTAWVASTTMGSAMEFAFQNLVTTIGVDGMITASGQIVNPATLPAMRVTVIAIFKNSSRIPLQISETEIDSVPAGGSTLFSITAPAIQNIDPLATELVAYALN
jgi:hypothetical protein